MFYKIVFLLALISSLQARGEFASSVMAPLKIGDVYAPDDTKNDADWNAFAGQLRKMKEIGVHAVSTDIWWGVVEPQDNNFNWKYYDKLVEHIRRSGLKWMPILSFHQCGGNIGDSCDFPIPSWIWTKYINHTSVKNEDSLKYKSEQANYSAEYVSVWGTEIVLLDYSEFMDEFQNHFSKDKDLIVEINVSLGPTGELRYPSYNSHDRGAGYPSRGALQAYSDLAVSSFRAFVKDKYQTTSALNEAWSTSGLQFEDIYPPLDRGGGPPNQFFQAGEHRRQYGKDFFDWYNQSLVNHGKRMIANAIKVFANGPFQGIDVGAKIPGVHWRMSSDRLAELAAGLIRTSDEKAFIKGRDGRTPASSGYENLVSVFDRARLGDPKVVMHFTCLEKDNDEEASRGAASLAQTLVFWIAGEADKRQIPIKGENALSWPLANSRAWENMRNAVQYASYRGLTILRLGEMNDFAIEQYRKFIEFASRFGI